MPYSKYTNKSHDIAELTLKRIGKDNIFPTPENYELWFVYYSKSNADLNKAIDVMVKENGEALSNEQCYELFTEFLRCEREEMKVQYAGNKIKDAISDVSVVVYSAKEQAGKYNKKLKFATKIMKENKSKVAIDDLLNNVIADTDEMIEHSQYLESMLDYSTKEMENMRRDLEIARKEAITDTLTGLSNRKAFNNEIEHLIELSNGDEPHVFSMILLDIDNFKSFNDNFGHQIGDQVLKLIARILKDGLKGRDLAVRYGGEEFAILLPETDIQGGMKIADILRHEVENKDLINRATGKKIAKITFSAGVAEYDIGEKTEDFIERVDSSLYTAKKSGRNQVIASKHSASS